MQADSTQIRDITDLREYVYHTLCIFHDFEPGAFDITERILVRGGSPCGIYFCLHGPRSVKLTAIWETDRNTILFYAPTGERLHRAELEHAPSLVAA